MKRGRALGVDSTPTIYLNNRPVPFPEVNVSSMRRLIDAELQQASSQPTGAPANAN
ncbi:MAG: DsbA family protein [Acidobacteria bacterium]|nr:DsbA family protein [Acidobacteriota bacterium]